MNSRALVAIGLVLLLAPAALAQGTGGGNGADDRRQALRERLARASSKEEKLAILREMQGMTVPEKSVAESGGAGEQGATSGAGPAPAENAFDSEDHKRRVLEGETTAEGRAKDTGEKRPEDMTSDELFAWAKQRRDELANKKEKEGNLGPGEAEDLEQLDRTTARKEELDRDAERSRGEREANKAKEVEGKLKVDEQARREKDLADRMRREREEFEKAHVAEEERAHAEANAREKVEAEKRQAEQEIRNVEEMLGSSEAQRIEADLDALYQFGGSIEMLEPDYDNLGPMGPKVPLKDFGIAMTFAKVAKRSIDEFRKTYLAKGYGPVDIDYVTMQLKGNAERSNRGPRSLDDVENWFNLEPEVK
ncbi:MAG: hypothetical protein HY720_13195 [Planctomycetes bacterium]|nr:hypothetical protein [Planctomycetota bacterium]